MNEHFTVVEAYLVLSQALETAPHAYAAVLHPRVEQTEYPNRFSPVLERRQFDDILRTVRSGREMLQDAQFTNTKMYAAADGSVMVETAWSATSVTSFNGLTPGGRLAAQLCMAFEFEDNLIIRQRTYRIFERDPA